MEKTLRNINGVYYIIYMLTILSAVAVFMLTYTNVNLYVINENTTVGRALSSIIIIYILISIPLAFWLFHKKTKTLQKIEDKFAMFNAYKNASILRLWVVGMGLIGGVMLFYFLHSTNMMYCALISAVALFFCKPTENRMIKELNLEEEI